MASERSNVIVNDFANVREGALTAAAVLLESSSEYQILRKLKERSQYFQGNGNSIKYGVILDTETTGFNCNKDVLIELGMIKFEYDEQTGRVFNVVGTFDQLEAPSFPIPPSSTLIHGITDQMVEGKKIDDVALNEFLKGVEIVIAHNAQFDRPFTEKRFPTFVKKRWGCSLDQINWKREGIGSVKLEYLAYHYGFFYDAHRASEDCRALLEVLQHPLPASGEIALKTLIVQMKEKCYKIYAISAPFDKKDLLKERGYRWNPTLKVWHSASVDQIDMNKEIEWLKGNVYCGKSVDLEFEEIDSETRYSGRQSVIITKTI